MNSRPFGRSVLALLCMTLTAVSFNAVNAADPTFVGILSLVDDNAVSRQLQLSDSQRDQLMQLIRQRESQALEMAISTRRLSAEERKERLAEFVAESERQGFELLSDRQVTKLKQSQLRRQGLSSLGDPALVEQLKLSEDQQQQVRQILQERDQELRGADRQRAVLLRAQFERRLAQVLNADQSRTWDQLSSGEAVTSTIPVAGNNDEADDETENDVSATTGDAEVADAKSVADTDLVAETNPLEASRVQTEVENTGSDSLRFNFRYAPWQDVLDWFAEQAGLSMLLDAPPPGTFNYTDGREYTPAEAIDLINSVLLTKGYTLVRRDRMLLLVNLEDGVPPNLVTSVPVAELDERGEFELVSCLFQLNRVSPDDVREEIVALVGPQGSVEVLSQARQLLVTETAGRLRTIRDVLQAIEDPDDLRSREVTTIDLQHIRPNEAFPVIRQMMGLPEDQNAALDDSFRMTVDPSGARIMLKGRPEAIQQIEDIVRLVDVPDRKGILNTPQLEVYSVVSADPQSVFDVIETLIGAEPEVQLASDPKTGKLVAMGLPSHHATIRATLDQLEKDGQSIEVIKLRYLDPQLALLSINKLFGATEEGGAMAPRVDADVTSSQLMVRGTANQIEQIRTLMQKMGEGDEEYTSQNQQRQNLRLLPLTGADSAAILKQAEQIWPTMRTNRIRTAVPSEGIPSLAPEQEDDESTDKPLSPDGPPRRRTIRVPAAQKNGPVSTPVTTELDLDPAVADDASTSADLEMMNLFQATPIGQLLALQTQPIVDPVINNTESGNSTNDDEQAGQGEENADNANVPGADIVIVQSPNGLLVGSRDLDALDEFENLIVSLSQREASGSEFAVFYLRHATAESAAAVLTEVLGGSSSSGGGGGGGGGGGLLGSLAGAALGDAGGGLVGSLLGLGGQGGAATYSSSGSFKIVTEPRLNFLIVQANAEDMQLIESMLEIIDQRQSNVVVETIPAPRAIPVRYVPVNEIAQVVREVYANRLANGGGSGRQRQPSPEEFIRALRGGGGNRSKNDRAAEEQTKMTVGVDARRNSLIVVAPDVLFTEVQTLVEQLDQPNSEVMETSRVVTLREADPELVRQALSALVGESNTSGATLGASAGSSGAGSGGGSSSSSSGSARERSSGDGRSGSNFDRFRRQMEFMRAIQQQSGRSEGSKPSRD